MAVTGAVFALFSMSLFLLGQCANSNNNGTLTLDNVATDHIYQSSGEYNEGGFPLTTTWRLIDSFLHTISPAPPPYDLINGIISGSETFTINLLTGNITQFRGNLMGFAICFIIGALFVVIFPLVALCFCCCRCCGNCGGKMLQKQGNYDRVKRIVFGFSLAVCLGFIVGGVATAFSVNTFTSQNVETLPQDVIANIDDMLSYVENTVQEINFTAIEQLRFTLRQVAQDLIDIDKLVGVPVKNDLSANVQPAIDAIYPLDTAIRKTYNGLININTTQAVVETTWREVETRVVQAKADIDTACTSCSCCSGPDWPDTTGLTMNADWRDIDTANGWGTFPQPAVDDAITSMEDVNNAGLSAAADQGSANFNKLPETLKNTTQSEIDAILNTINDLEAKIADLLAPISDQLSAFNTPADDIKDTISTYTPYVQDYDPYRSYALIGFFSILLVIAVLFLLGLLLGVAGYNKDVDPTERGGCSHCGGVFLMAGVGIAFIFMTIFMLFTMLLFIIGGPPDRLVCDPLISGELFAETIDKEDAIGEGFYLGQLLFQDGSIPLTVTDILNKCENNVAAFEAFQLDNFLNITALIDYKQYIPNIDNEFDNVAGDLSNVVILTAATRQILTDFRDSPADTLNWTSFQDELAKDLTNDVYNGNDLSVLAGRISTFASTQSAPNDATFQGFTSTLTDLQTNYIAPLLSQRDALSAYIGALQSVTSTIDTLVNATIDAADAAQSYLDTSGPTFISQQVRTYKNRILGYPEQYVEYALRQVQNQIGKCRPVYNLYTGFVNSICRGVLESVNALWLIMGWCVFFLVPASIFGVKLAKHYRRMKYPYGGSYGGDMEMVVQNNTFHGSRLPSNKVAPSY